MRSLAPVHTEAAPTPAAPQEATATSETSVPLAVEENGLGDAEFEAPSPRRSRAIVGATIASVIWLGAATAAIYLLAQFRPPADLTLTGLAGLAAGITAPLTAIWLVALVLSRATADERRLTIARLQATEARVADVAARTRQELAAIDGVLSAVADRVEAIRGSMGTQATQMMETAGRLEERSRTISGSLASDREAIERLLDRLAAGGSQARSELSSIVASLPVAEEQARAIAIALAASAADAKRHVGEIDAMVAASHDRSVAARNAIESAAERLAEAIGAIDAVSSSATERLETRTAALSESADTALARTADAVDAARKGIEVQVAAVRASTEQARVVLQGFGGEATRQVTERFAEATAQAERLTREMQEQETRSRSLIENVERGFGVLDAKLANAAQSSEGVLERLNERLAAVRDQVHELTTPLTGTQAATRELEGAVAVLRTTALESADALGAMLPAHLEQTSQAVETVRSAIGALAADIATLRIGATDITAPVEASRASIETMLAALDGQRESLAASVADINARLSEARDMAAAVDTDAQRAALTATTRLVEAMTRVREVAAQAEGTMRTALEGVIAETREAVAAASQDAMHETFTKRVRVEIAEVEAVGEKVAQAAQATAERLSRQMISVAETAAAVEARIIQADTRLEAASQEDLARRSGLLIEALNSSSIDIAKSLSTDVSDTAWAAYMKGDRSIFTRRAVRLLDGGDARTIARRYGEDPEFRDAVTRYVHDFEALMRRTLAEREGGPLSVTLLSSDVGKLYVALAQALERIKN